MSSRLNGWPIHSAFCYIEAKSFVNYYSYNLIFWESQTAILILSSFVGVTESNTQVFFIVLEGKICRWIRYCLREDTKLILRPNSFVKILRTINPYKYILSTNFRNKSLKHIPILFSPFFIFSWKRIENWSWKLKCPDDGFVPLLVYIKGCLITGLNKSWKKHPTVHSFASYLTKHLLKMNKTYWALLR